MRKSTNLPQATTKLTMFFHNISIVTMFLQSLNYQNIINNSPNDETTLSKKNTKTYKKNIKLKKKRKKSKG